MWNIFDEYIDITSGISGTGSKIWLWMRRFGKSSATTSGVYLEQDRIYIGNIRPMSICNNTSFIPRDIHGQVAIGWGNEQNFIGYFRMRPTLDWNT